MNLRAVALVAACTVAFAPSVSARTAAAGEVRVTFTNGRVTVIADNATLGEILQEWARVGGSRFVNAEKLASIERLTLRLENETEVRALEVLLRSVPGYVAAPRAAGMRGASSVGNVLIMPVSQAGSFAQAERVAEPSPALAQTPARQPQITAAPPRPDDDGPTRQTTPPPAQHTAPMMGQTMPGAPQGATQQSGPTQPRPAAGQSSPLGGTQTQTAPGLGPTTSQPGSVIPNPRPGGGRPVISPTQPRPVGGGG